MKNTLLLAALIGALFTSCKKDDENPTTTTSGPSKTSHISKDSSYVTGDPYQTEVRSFQYNSDKKLVLVKYKNGISTTYDNYDTIIYSSGQISKVEKYSSGSLTPFQTNTYNYVSGLLSTVVETGSNFNGPFERTRTFTYSGGKVTSQTVVYTTGTNNGDFDDANSIIFTGNNISSANIVAFGPITITSDLAALNPYYGLNFDSGDLLNLFNKNNVLEIYFTADPANPLVDNTYTYANGKVATITDNAQAQTTVKVLTYIEL